MADSGILSATRQQHLICTTDVSAHACVCVCLCARMVSGIGILTVFHIREGETSECYCKRSTSCRYAKFSLPLVSLVCVRTHTHKRRHTKILTSKICFLFLPALPLSIFLCLHPPVSLSLISRGLLRRADRPVRMKENKTSICRGRCP